MKNFLIILLLNPLVIYSQWVQQPVSSDINMVLTIDFADQNTGIAGGWTINSDFSGRLLYTTNSGSNWLAAQFPDSSRAMVKVQMINSLTGYVAGAYNSILPEYKGRSVIKNINRPFGNDTDIKYSQNGMEYLPYAGYRGMFLKTTNGGQTWNIINTLPSNVFYLVSMRFVNLNTGFVGASFEHNAQGLGGVLKTTNGGLTWTTVLTVDSVETQNITTFDGVNIFTGFWGRNGNTFCGFIMRSSNSGANWSRQNFPGTVAGVNDINFTSASTGFAVTMDSLENAMILKTTDAGLSWSRLGFQPNIVIYHAIDFVSGTGKGIAAGYNGMTQKMIISRTTDFGVNWTTYAPNDSTLLNGISLIDQNIWFVCGGRFLSTGKIFKSTTGGAIGILPISNEIPQSFSLYQNYPNPFNPLTKIRFSIPLLRGVDAAGGRGVSTKLVVFNITGREVTTLVNEQLKPGTYEVSFDAANYSSGVYFYKLSSGDYSATNKMILLK